MGAVQGNLVRPIPATAHSGGAGSGVQVGAYRQIPRDAISSEELELMPTVVRLNAIRIHHSLGEVPRGRDRFIRPALLREGADRPFRVAPRLGENIVEFRRPPAVPDVRQ